MSKTRETIRDWWQHNLGARESAAARGLAARLRRAASPVDVAAEPAVHLLAQRLGRRVEVLPVAQVLAHIRTDDAHSLAWRMGPGLREPRVAPGRFERLIRTSRDDLVPALRRVLPIVDRRCDVGRLGSDMLFWNEATRIRWTFDYYNTEVPGSDTEAMAEMETN